MRFKKGIVSILMIAMILQITGCKTAVPNNIAMGRYIEKEVSMPSDFVNLENSLYVGMGINSTNQLELYTIDLALTKYTLTSNGDWKSEEIDWYQELVKGSQIQQALYVQDKNGNEYVELYELQTTSTDTLITDTSTEEKTAKIQIYCHTSKGAIQEIKGDIEKIGDNGLPNQIHILDNGRILIAYGIGATLFDKSGNELVRYEEGMGSSLTITEDEIYMLNEAADTVLAYAIATGECTKSIDISNKGYNNGTSWRIHMMTDNNQNIYLSNFDGIHKLSQGGTIWETIIDGNLNSLCMPSYNSYSLCQDIDDNFYHLFNDEYGNYLINQYIYDDEVPAVPSTELSVYSLYEEKTIIQAIVKFQKENPNVKVNYHFDIGENDSDVNTSDYIRALNTELLAGNGADLIVFDGMDINDYIDKGVLRDITDVLKTCTDTDTVFENITNTYKRENAIFAVPISINLPLVLGKKEAVAASDTLQQLVSYVTQEDLPPIFGDITYEDLAKNLYEQYYNELLNKDGEFQEDMIKEFFVSIEKLAEQTKCLNEYSNDSCVGNMGVLHGVAQLEIQNYNSTEDIGCVMQVAKDIDGEWKIPNNQYLPNLVVGINKASKQNTLADQFLQLLLSDEIVSYYGEGIPVNKANSISNLKSSWANDIIMTYGYSYNGEFTLYDVKTTPEDDLKKYVKMLENLNTPIFLDETIENKVLEVVGECFEKDLTVDEAVQKIMNYINLYNEE